MAEVLAALSLVTDLARGQHAEEAMQACLLAMYLAGHLNLARGEREQVYYTTLLRHAGCTASSHEYARFLGGDDIAVRREGDRIDAASPREALSFVLGLGKHAPLARRARIVAGAAPRAKGVAVDAQRASCEVASRMARRFRLGPEVERALYEAFERWDGRGTPRGLAGEAVALPARFANVAFVAIMFHSTGGPEAAISAVHRWAGKALDPAIASAFVERGRALLHGVASDDAWAAVLAAEPAPHRSIGSEELDELARGFADAVDLKSPYFHGHASGVAVLAEAAARRLALPAADVLLLRRAGLLHDLGRAGVATGIWEKPGALSRAEWELVRLHPYHTERILSRSTALAPLAPVACAHHERLSGRGYHKGLPAMLLDMPARVLAAADVYHALTESRPHRPAFSPDAAAKELSAQAVSGGLDRAAVAAVLEAAGQAATAVRAAWPVGLTDREIDVLRLLARGLSMKEIGKVLFISPSTVHTHVAHIYEKTGVSTRAAAALFAMEHALLHR